MMYLTMASVTILNCSMMEMPSGIFGCGVFRSMLLTTQTFSFESRARARTPIPARKLSALEGSFIGNRTTVSDEELATQTRFWESMTMSKGDFSPADLDDLAVLDSSAGEVQQLIVGAIGNPDVTVRGNADAHQAEEFLFEWEIAFAGDRLAVEIHHQNFAVEAGDPDPVFGHGRAPADAVNAHAGEAGDRRGERDSVGS